MENNVAKFQICYVLNVIVNNHLLATIKNYRENIIHYLRLNNRSKKIIYYLWYNNHQERKEPSPTILFVAKMFFPLQFLYFNNEINCISLRIQMYQKYSLLVMKHKYAEKDFYLQGHLYDLVYDLFSWKINFSYD